MVDLKNTWKLSIECNWKSIERLQYIWNNEKKENINYSNVLDVYKKIAVSIPENVLNDIPKHWENEKKRNLTIRKKFKWKIIISKDDKIRYIDTEEFKRWELDRFDLIEILKQFVTQEK